MLLYGSVKLLVFSLCLFINTTHCRVQFLDHHHNFMGQKSNYLQPNGVESPNLEAGNRRRPQAFMKR